MSAPVVPECAAGTVSVKSHDMLPNCSATPSAIAGPIAEFPHRYVSATSASSSDIPSGDADTVVAVPVLKHLGYAPSVLVKKHLVGRVPVKLYSSARSV